MKKALALLLATVMLLSLAACGVENQPTTGNKKDPATAPTTPTTQPTTPTTKPTEPTEPSKPEDNSTVIAENDSFVLKVLSVTSDAESYTLALYMENKSAATLSLNVSNVSANDYVCPDIFMYCDLAAGQNATDVLTIERAVLDRNGITDPTKVEFSLFVMDAVSWAEVYNASCAYYPMGEENHVDDGGYTAKEGDTVLVDNESCTVIVTGYEPDNALGYTMNLYILNKTALNLTFSLNNVTVNGLMLDPWWSTEMAAGKRAHCSVTWFGSEMTDYNIGDVTMISFGLSALDATNWEAADLAGVTATVYPMGEEAAKPFERPSAETDIVLMDNEYVTIIATSIGTDADGNYTMVLYMQNKAWQNIFIKPSNVCINGIELDPWWGATVTAGKATFGSISWFASDFEYNGITAVETITMTVSVFDEFGMETFVTEDITIHP